MKRRQVTLSLVAAALLGLASAGARADATL